MKGDPRIRRATDLELGIVNENFRRMWIDMGWEPQNLREDSAEVVTGFIERARAEGQFAAFVAEVDSEVVGSAACQVLSGLYPEIRLSASHLAGYIWGVYVAPAHRRRGIATGLTRATLDHLHAIGCTLVKLHASPFGEPVYRAMGFSDTNELALPTPSSSPTRGTS